MRSKAKRMNTSKPGKRGKAGQKSSDRKRARRNNKSQERLNAIEDHDDDRNQRLA